MEINYIKSVSEFVEEIFSKIEGIRGEFDDAVWYRGEASEHYSLVPNLFRNVAKDTEPYCSDIKNLDEFYIIERNIDSSFYRKASVFFANKRIENSQWNRYFLKQHYGIKTRLLDWTENALFALFFAVNDKNQSKTNGKVSILLPHKLNKYSVSKFLGKDYMYDRIATLSKVETKGPLYNEKKELRIVELYRQYYSLDFEEDKAAHPLAIYPPHLDERMSAQQACFTLFGNITNGLNCKDAKARFIDTVYIEAESKSRILKELRLMGISYYSIYPDLDGLGETINYDVYGQINMAQSFNKLSEQHPD